MSRKQQTGQKLWQRAKSVIPGGNMLLSKRAEMFLPEAWPTYFSKSKGCYVWDLDDNRYIDMSIMGIGTNILGYGHTFVDSAVHAAITNGNMSTFNCPEEVYLAEKLCELHPWASMARFARSGGEANAIAIRIARAASGKSKVAICGYHGWHDWYLSVNLSSGDKLSDHLLPGLEPNGVPIDLAGSVIPFEYNNYQELVSIISDHDIGVIKMEVQRNHGPKDDFLLKVRKLADDNNIVLIFDECTSGFRETFGGIHLKYHVFPDLAVFGKALGNGYAISAVIGKESIMQCAQSSFISSTFWSERIGPTAALATLSQMENQRSWEYITLAGKRIRNGWLSLSSTYQVPLTITGIPAISAFSVNCRNPLAAKTYITQEMLKLGYLSSNLIFVSTSHTDEIIDTYLQALGRVFSILSNHIETTAPPIDSLLEGPVCHSGFHRLN
ncbi:aminotransferase class III-fold pyridoxal phosphate-dependent enzyme [Prochlorococcus marinus]|uniref:aminotransferase class III-fold pyridoxal phosphate-dependent enzyme n=1 Tax=Prochlorococcus marinus TaxID=1219 RepID=UPI0007B3BBCA|nr:aminotransferase class III-fold pyridoxal phosphate-dependent enzyme [Prochlorococcus marinus]KZR73702.1 3-aminobutyryl-CoA aminotransferase [Prochlorococcus marinus str. MIT 1320]